MGRSISNVPQEILNRLRELKNAVLLNRNSEKKECLKFAKQKLTRQAMSVSMWH
jgi:predicted transcriptional regulator